MSEPLTPEHRRHLERGCECPQYPSCVQHGAREFGGGEPDRCIDHDHVGPVVDWHGVASELAPATLAEWDAVVARHTSQALDATRAAERTLDVEALRDAVDVALFDAEVGDTHPGCRTKWRRIAMDAFDRFIEERSRG